ncbi:MAG: hypothetical protein EHM37_05290, partial [Deltaproteobacteria bacterium]
RLKVAPDRVYVIPPNKDLSILHGVLHLLEPAAPRGLRLPIDFFFLKGPLSSLRFHQILRPNKSFHLPHTALPLI